MRKAIGLASAVETIPDGAVLMIGGFMGVGTPPRLVEELIRQGKRLHGRTGAPRYGSPPDRPYGRADDAAVRLTPIVKPASSGA